jgi:hypothetical protein
MERDSDDEHRQFAEARSHQDADSSNQNARATAQAVILINGGAATAVLAFLTKDKINPHLVHTVAMCLVGYAGGVLAGAVMMFCAVTSLDYYSQRWMREAHPRDDSTAEENRARAERWWHGMRGCFALSTGLFFVSSCGLAWTLYCFR